MATVVVLVTVLVVVTVVVSESSAVLVEVDCTVTVEVCTGAVDVTVAGQGVTVVSRKLEQSLEACAGPGDALLAKTYRSTVSTMIIVVVSTIELTALKQLSRLQTARASRPFPGAAETTTAFRANTANAIFILELNR